MKTIIFMAVICCSLCFLSSYGQTEKGTYMLGGGAGADFSITNGSNSFSISLAPDIGYFFADNLAIGTYLPLSLYLRENYSYFNYGISPFFRYYLNQSSQIMYFITGELGIRASSSKYNDTSSSSSGITGKAGVGGTHFINENIGLEAILGYNFIKWKDSDAISDITVNIGFQIFFGR